MRPATMAGLVLGVLLAVPVGANVGLFERGTLPVLANEQAATDIAIADLDGSAPLDIYIAMGNLTGVGAVQVPQRDVILIGKGGQFFFVGGSLPDAAMPGADMGVAIADFDRDGDGDVATAGGTSYDGTSFVVSPSRLYRNGGNADFADGGVLGVAADASAIVAADIDGDGDADLAVGRATGNVDIFRNDTPVGAGTFQFVLAQSVAVGTTRVQGLAAGQLGGDARRDLAVLRANGGFAVTPPGVTLLVNLGGATPFAPGDSFVLSGGQLNDIAAGDLDGNGFDDIVVAASTSAAGESLSRIVMVDAAGMTVSAFRFPRQSHTAVAIGNLDGTGALDIALLKNRCEASSCAPSDASAVAIWLAEGDSWRHNGQCLGQQAISGRALAIAALDGAGDDLVTLGARAATPGADGIVAWFNDAAPSTGLCCVAQYAAEYGEAVAPAVTTPLPEAPRAVAAADITAYSAVRDVLMADAINGPRLRDRYAQFSAEIVARMLTDATLWRDAADVLTQWSDPVRALVDGEGTSATVTVAMLDAVDGFLDRLATGSAPLAQAIADERAQLPPFATLAGLDMDAFRAIVLPREAPLFRNGFE